MELGGEGSEILGKESNKGGMEESHLVFHDAIFAEMSKQWTLVLERPAIYWLCDSVLLWAPLTFISSSVK